MFILRNTNFLKIIIKRLSRHNHWNIITHNFDQFCIINHQKKWVLWITCWCAHIIILHPHISFLQLLILLREAGLRLQWSRSSYFLCNSLLPLRTVVSEIINVLRLLYLQLLLSCCCRRSGKLNLRKNIFHFMLDFHVKQNLFSLVYHFIVDYM